jgi:uncharacterized protein (DUF2249 family)
MNTNQSLNEEVFDARDLPCEIKRPSVIQRCLDLPAGRSFILVNQHDPVPVRRHLDASFPGCFRWERADGSDDDEVRIRVIKLKELPSDQPDGVADFSCH